MKLSKKMLKNVFENMEDNDFFQVVWLDYVKPEVEEWTICVVNDEEDTMNLIEDEFKTEKEANDRLSELEKLYSEWVLGFLEEDEENYLMPEKINTIDKYGSFVVSHKYGQDDYSLWYTDDVSDEFSGYSVRGSRKDMREELVRYGLNSKEVVSMFRGNK